MDFHAKLQEKEKKNEKRKLKSPERDNGKIINHLLCADHETQKVERRMEITQGLQKVEQKTLSNDLALID